MSDELMGNEPNLIPFDEQLGSPNVGPSQVDPGSIGDLDGKSSNPNSVEGSGAPGPITCGNNWVGVAQVNIKSAQFFDFAKPGNLAAPGMIVDCGTGGSPPHTP